MLVQRPNRFFSNPVLVKLSKMVLYNPGRTSSYPEDPPEKGFRFHYLGGGNEVGNVGIMLENQNKNKLMKFQPIQVYNKFNKTYNNNNKY